MSYPRIISIIATFLLLSLRTSTAYLICVECWSPGPTDLEEPPGPPTDWADCSSEQRLRECVGSHAAHECFNMQYKKKGLSAQGCATAQIKKKFKINCLMERENGMECLFCKSHFCNNAQKTNISKTLIVFLLIIPLLK